MRETNAQARTILKNTLPKFSFEYHNCPPKRLASRFGNFGDPSKKHVWIGIGKVELERVEHVHFGLQYFLIVKSIIGKINKI